MKQIFSQKLPNVPGKTLTVVEVDYRPGGFSAPHRHPASGFVFAYVLSGAIRSQVEGEPLGVYRVGQSWTEPPNAHHIVSANASKTEPARLIAYIRLRQVISRRPGNRKASRKEARWEFCSPVRAVRSAERWFVA